MGDCARSTRRPLPQRSLTRARVARVFRRLSPLRELRILRRVVAVMALILGAYCLLSAAAAPYAETPPGNPSQAELAAAEWYQWPGLIPVLWSSTWRCWWVMW